MQPDEVFLPRAVHIYDGARTDALHLEEIAGFVRSILPTVSVVVESDVTDLAIERLSGSEKEQRVDGLARELAMARVHNIAAQEETDSVSHGEVDYERRRMLDASSKAFGILYDGHKLTAMYADLIPEEQLDVENAHVIFTNQLFGTWDENDLRYHARVAVYSYPSIISTSGIVEAPARPRDFYLKRQLGVDPLRLKEEFRGRVMDHDDPRLTDAMKGYVAQALFYHMTGEPFCQNKTCRLFNAHWQEELIHAQLTGDDFCPEHAALLFQAAE
jgi:hypothetical protein